MTEVQELDNLMERIANTPHHQMVGAKIIDRYRELRAKYPHHHYGAKE